MLLILLLAATALLVARYPATGRLLVFASAMLLLFGGVLPLSTWLILPLEQPVYARRTARHAHAIDGAAERLTEAAALARCFPQAKVVLTGGGVQLLSAPTVGADGLVMRDLGIGDDGRLLLEREARDTWENAVKTKALVDPKPGERWLLVTSASHMPRAMGAFRRTGFHVEPWPVDYRTAGWEDDLLSLPLRISGARIAAARPRRSRMAWGSSPTDCRVIATKSSRTAEPLR